MDSRRDLGRRAWGPPQREPLSQSVQFSRSVMSDSLQPHEL